MVYPVKTDILPLLRNLVEGIRLYAEANGVALLFESDPDSIEMEYHPQKLLPDLTQILCQVITYTPQDDTVTIQAGMLDDGKQPLLQIKIFNTSTDLTGFLSIRHGLTNKVVMNRIEPQGTSFDIHLPLETISAPQIPNKSSSNSDYEFVPEFYKKLRKQLHTYFSSIKNLEKVAETRSKRDGIFLKKLNAILMANLDKEGFDASELATALALSRSQLYRKLKPLVGFSPAHYIRYVRLQKAKEFLEKGEGNIGDVAFNVGFVSQSHFTRAFKEQFGFNPSHITRQQES
ncbi:MAG: AraC family transcriptional regulator [Bacteroidetes bacterium]|nr:MAG: AraC family transcriptional regulator [Bacteroidota bacterium]